MVVVVARARILLLGWLERGIMGSMGFHRSGIIAR
jgi:hypothetical protein